jgi:hypothetical protein
MAQMKRLTPGERNLAPSIGRQPFRYAPERPTTGKVRFAGDPKDRIVDIRGQRHSARRAIMGSVFVAFCAGM